MNSLLKKRMLIISISLAFLLLINIGVSYSYYLGKVVGNESDTTLSFKSAGIKVQYENNSGEINVADIMPGWSVTKNFSLSSNILETDFTNDQTKLWYEIILYVDQNDFPTDILTYTLAPSETVVGSGLVAEARTNAGIATGTNAEGVSIGVGYFTVGSNKHDYSITFNYAGNGSEYGNYPDNTFSVHIGAKVIISSVLNIDLDGGSIEGDTTKYIRKGGTINLPIPIKVDAMFSGWVITSGNGEVDGNNVTVNDEVLNISAVWLDKIVNSVLVLDLDGGSSTQDTINNIKTREIYTLVEPTREGYLFRGWQLVSGNADISGDKIIVYDENVKVVAIWEYAVPEFTYLKSDGTAAKYTLLNDTSSDWRIKFFESGTLTFTTYGNADNGIDVFLVGGGGAGGAGRGEGAGYGGGGGYTQTVKKYNIQKDLDYNIVIGSGGQGRVYYNGYSGKETTAFTLSANGGAGGGNGYNGGGQGAGGQSIGEFGELGNEYSGSNGRGTLTAGAANTGRGGGGGRGYINGVDEAGGNGGSGIVIIRNARGE